MSEQVYPVDNPDALRRAGPTDLIELVPPPGANPLYLPKHKLEILAYAISGGEIVHLSGPTGSAKSSLVEALALPENFCALCESLGFPSRKPVKLYPIQMATFEAPGDLYQRRALKDGTTYDEKSPLVRALEQAERATSEYYPLIWLREMGRVHSASIQGGLLDLMSKTDIILPDGGRIDGKGIAWVSDSNYQAEADATHTLVTLDDGLKRRFTVHATLSYLSAEQEAQVLYQLLARTGQPRPDVGALVPRIVRLGHAIRQQRLEGNLQSVAPPSIYGYLALLRMAQALPHLTPQELVFHTLLGNTTAEDGKTATAVFNEVFGLLADLEDETRVGGNWF